MSGCHIIFVLSPSLQLARAGAGGLWTLLNHKAGKSRNRNLNHTLNYSWKSAHAPLILTKMKELGIVNSSPVGSGASFVAQGR
jgi:hypothetical protein